jgi:phenylalanyl-tRNA synthetase beta chain
MKISEHWLRESVDLGGIDRALLLAKLTAAGLEVEGTEAVAGEFNHVIVGEIVECEKHPDADRLRVCKVNTGKELLQIVCGAPNARIGLKAPLAMIGAALPNGLQIKLGKLRGVESHGMLCSGTELGVADVTELGLAAGDGLLELPADAPVGASIREYLDLDDCVIELKMTPNRSDCLSVRGLTRELCALFNASSRFADATAGKSSTDTKISIDVQDAAACPSYLGQIVRGINPNAQTPRWMQVKLRRAGLRCIHPVVDITNYVMLEYGQPMHGFDASKINGGIVVRRARAGESVKLLDEQTVTLTPEFLVIADHQNAVAIAGVMGGFDSRVTESTTDVLFEAAHFAPSVIMGKARALGMHTDSSHRFERGVDPHLPALAMARAVQLLQSIAGGDAGPLQSANANAQLPKSTTITLRSERIAALLGLHIPDQRVDEILGSLGFHVQRVQGAPLVWQVQASSARFDIQIEADLIEELARVYGYEHIPVSLPRLSLQPIAKTESQRESSALLRVMTARDYLEAITFAFTSSQLLTHFGLRGCALKNPLAAEIDVMRPSLLPNLLQALAQNQKRQLARVRLFEMGRRFSADGLQETESLALVASGDARAEQWGETARALDFYDIKGDVEALLGAQSGELRYEALSADHAYAKFMHPARSASVWRGDVCIGVVGQLHPALMKPLELKALPLVAELDLAAVQARALPAASALSKFPSSRRDLAVVVPESVAFAELEASVRKACGEGLVEFQCFDVYRGKGLPEAHKSLAISLILQDISRTLSDSEVDAKIDAVVKAIASDVGGSLRA